MSTQLSPEQLRPPEGIRILYAGAAIVACLLGIYFIHDVVAPVFLAITLVLTVRPLVVWLDGHRVPKILGSLIGMLVVFLVLLAILFAVTLAMSVLKGDKMDAVVRDATMMGVTTLQPVVSARSARGRIQSESRYVTVRMRQSARSGYAPSRRPAPRPAVPEWRHWPATDRGSPG